MVGTKNIFNESSAKTENVLHFPYTYNRNIQEYSPIDIIKQFTKAFPKDGVCFQYLTSKFPKISNKKLRKVIFVDPEMKDSDFNNIMSVLGKNAWVSFREAVEKFLRNRKDPNCTSIVYKMLDGRNKLGFNIVYDEFSLFSYALVPRKPWRFEENSSWYYKHGEQEQKYDGRLLFYVATRV